MTFRVIFFKGWSLLVFLGAHSLERVLGNRVSGQIRWSLSKKNLRYSCCCSLPSLNAGLTFLKDLVLLKCQHLVWNLLEGLWRVNSSLRPKPSASICSFYAIHSAKLPPRPPHCLIVPLESAPWHVYVSLALLEFWFWGCNCQVNLACMERDEHKE